MNEKKPAQRNQVKCKVKAVTVRELKWEGRFIEEPGRVYFLKKDGSALNFLKSYLMI